MGRSEEDAEAVSRGNICVDFLLVDERRGDCERSARYRSGSPGRDELGWIG